MIKVENLTKRYAGFTAIQDLNFEVEKGEIVGFLGPNGAGKSLLVSLLTHHERAIAPADAPSAVRVFGEDRWNVAELRSQLGIVSADLHQRFVAGNSEGSITGEAAVLSAFLVSHGILRYGAITDDMGAWLSYGLGSENQNLPAFVVLLSQAHALTTDQPLFSRLWASGFLPSSYQGVRFRNGGAPVLFLQDPPGIERTTRRQMLDAGARLNLMQREAYGDPEIETRIAQYEMAYRMQTSVPELTDLSKEPDSVFEMYGPESRKPGSYAANCLLARRLAERNVRFIQLYHRGWDQHGNLPRDIRLQCRGTDQPTAALITDLKQRGLLDDTLVIWGGEFGRTVFSQGKLTEVNYGRDHHPRNFCMRVAVSLHNSA